MFSPINTKTSIVLEFANAIHSNENDFDFENWCRRCGIVDCRERAPESESLRRDCHFKGRLLIQYSRRSGLRVLPDTRSTRASRLDFLELNWLKLLQQKQKNKVEWIEDGEAEGCWTQFLWTIPLTWKQCALYIVDILWPSLISSFRYEHLEKSHVFVSLFLYCQVKLFLVKCLLL